MADLFRVIALVCACFLAAPAVAQEACGSGTEHVSQDAYSQNCQTYVFASCPLLNGIAMSCRWGSCVSSGVTKPFCERKRVSNGAVQSKHFFIGTCSTSEPGEGPQFEFTGAGAPPSDMCFGPCAAEKSHCSCIGMPNGEQKCVCSTTKTGGLCTPSEEPGVEEPPTPGECDESLQINGECFEVEDSDNNPQTPDDTEICIGETCIPLPPTNPEGDCAQGSNSALCVGPPGGGSAPEPGAPYPPNQMPDFQTNASSQNGPGAAPTLHSVDVYGPPNSQGTDPNENGDCPPGTNPLGNLCVCPQNHLWNGTTCELGEEDGEEDGEERQAGNGSCGTIPPSCSGDEIDCSVVYQTWVTRCALESSGERPAVDLTADPLEGIDLFGEPDSVGPGQLDAGGFLGGGSCPTISAIPVLGMSLEIPAVWCELSWLGTLLVSIAYLIALRIVYGE